MIARNCLVLLLISLMMGCASEPARLQYYLLHQPDMTVPTSINSTTQSISLTALQLPDYLKQRGMAMQTSATQLHFSSLHLWAEPLSNGLTQALRNSMWASAGVLIAPVDIANQASMPRLNILVEDFIATHQHEVVLKGQYWLTTEGKAPQFYLFDFRLPLEQDGFAHAVIQMRELVKMLGEDIAEQVVKQ